MSTDPDFNLHLTLPPTYDFAVQNWLITPVAQVFNETKPTSIKDQSWLLVLSGVVIINFKGSGQTWRRGTVDFSPDIIAPMEYVFGKYAIPRPLGRYDLKFQVEQCAAFTSLGSIKDEQTAVDAGFAVDNWRLQMSRGIELDTGGQGLSNLFTGISVDVAVSDVDAFIHRLVYHITLQGKIVFDEIWI